MSRFILCCFCFVQLPLSLLSQVQFTDVANEVGVHQNGKNYGVSIADYNNDGWDDFFVVRHDETCKLYRNNGDETFTDVTVEAGLEYVGTPAGAAWADINNDDWLDLFVGTRDEDNLLFLSNQDATFTNIATAAGVLEGGNVKAVLFSDINKDGYVDVYLARMLMENIMYVNKGDNTFLNFTAASNTTDFSISMGAIFFDYDNDGDPDLYLTHDGNQPFKLLQNTGIGYFIDVSEASGTNIAAMGMGVDFGDVNNDGWLDIYVTNLYENSLLLNNGDGTFSSIETEAGVDDLGMGWGCSFLDFDNDGWQDIYVANDSKYSPLPNVLYRNTGNNTFEQCSEGTPLASMEAGYGLACTDFNDDGMVDIYQTNFLGETGNEFYKNENTAGNNWVKIKGIGTTSNRAAIGTKVTLEVNGQLFTDEISGGSGYTSQNSLTLHFGLGSADVIDKITINWPNGLEEIYENFEKNKTYVFTEGAGFITAVKEAKSNVFAKAFISPNPASSIAELEYEIKMPTRISISILTASGARIKHFELGEQLVGVHQVELPIDGLSNGVYYVTLNTEFGKETLLLTKH